MKFPITTLGVMRVLATCFNAIACQNDIAGKLLNKFMDLKIVFVD